MEEVLLVLATAYLLKFIHSENHTKSEKIFNSNLLETALLPRFFVYLARYFKLWLHTYFFILLNCAKFEEDWTTFILDILQGSPLGCFLFL